MGEKTNNVFIYTDGGSRGNPGPAALGVYIADDKGNKLAGIGKRLGDNTNNFAEYSAVIEALNWIWENQEKIDKNGKVVFYMDSLLVYSQIKGLYKVKSENIRELIYTVREKVSKLPFEFEWNHIPREKNKKADELVNLALDNLI